MRSSDNFDDTPVQGFRDLNAIYDNALETETESLLLTEEEPRNYKEASKEKKWIEAMQAELDSINRNNTWNLTTLPTNRKAIGLKWVFKTKKEYATKMETCYVNKLQQLDVHYDVAKKLLEGEAKDCVVWDGKKKKLEIDTVDGYMTFMGIMKHMPTAMRYKDLLKRKINGLVEWFHKELMDCVFEAPLPPQIEDTEICLFDLYILVENMGGSEMVSQKDKWNDVTLSFGLPSYLKNRLRGIFGRYLEMLDSYYRTVMEERETATECRNAGNSTAVYIVLDDDNGRNMMAGNEGEEKDGETRDAHVIELDENEEVDQGIFGYSDMNIVYDNGERLVLTFEEGTDSNDEQGPSKEEYCNTADEEDSMDSK